MATSLLNRRMDFIHSKNDTVHVLTMDTSYPVKLSGIIFKLFNSTSKLYISNENSITGFQIKDASGNTILNIDKNNIYDFGGRSIYLKNNDDYIYSISNSVFQSGDIVICIIDFDDQSSNSTPKIYLCSESNYKKLFIGLENVPDPSRFEMFEYDPRSEMSINNAIEKAKKFEEQTVAFSDEEYHAFLKDKTTNIIRELKYFENDESLIPIAETGIVDINTINNTYQSFIWPFINGTGYDNVSGIQLYNSVNAQFTDEFINKYCFTYDELIRNNNTTLPEESPFILSGPVNTSYIELIPESERNNYVYTYSSLSSYNEGLTASSVMVPINKETKQMSTLYVDSKTITCNGKSAHLNFLKNANTNNLIGTWWRSSSTKSAILYYFDNNRVFLGLDNKDNINSILWFPDIISNKSDPEECHFYTTDFSNADVYNYNGINSFINTVLNFCNSNENYKKYIKKNLFSVYDDAWYGSSYIKNKLFNNVFIIPGSISRNTKVEDIPADNFNYSNMTDINDTVIDDILYKYHTFYDLYNQSSNRIELKKIYSTSNNKATPITVELGDNHTSTEIEFDFVGTGDVTNNPYNSWIYKNVYDSNGNYKLIKTDFFNFAYVPSLTKVNNKLQGEVSINKYLLCYEVHIPNTIGDGKHSNSWFKTSNSSNEVEETNVKYLELKDGCSMFIPMPYTKVNTSFEVSSVSSINDLISKTILNTSNFIKYSTMSIASLNTYMDMYYIENDAGYSTGFKINKCRYFVDRSNISQRSESKLYLQNDFRTVEYDVTNEYINAFNALGNSRWGDAGITSESIYNSLTNRQKTHYIIYKVDKEYKCWPLNISQNSNKPVANGDYNTYRLSNYFNRWNRYTFDWKNSASQTEDNQFRLKDITDNKFNVYQNNKVPYVSDTKNNQGQYVYNTDTYIKYIKNRKISEIIDTNQLLYINGASVNQEYYKDVSIFDFYTNAILYDLANDKSSAKLSLKNKYFMTRDDIIKIKSYDDNDFYSDNSKKTKYTLNSSLVAKAEGEINNIFQFIPMSLDDTNTGESMKQVYLTNDHIYASYTTTGNKTTYNISLTDSDETGNIYNTYGTLDTINTDVINWTNLLLCLNNNKQLDILGDSLIQEKHAFADIIDKNININYKVENIKDSVHTEYNSTTNMTYYVDNHESTFSNSGVRETNNKGIIAFETSGGKTILDKKGSTDPNDWSYNKTDPKLNPVKLDIDSNTGIITKPNSNELIIDEDTGFIASVNSKVVKDKNTGIIRDKDSNLYVDDNGIIRAKDKYDIVLVFDVIDNHIRGDSAGDAIKTYQQYSPSIIISKNLATGHIDRHSIDDGGIDENSKVIVNTGTLTWSKDGVTIPIGLNNIIIKNVSTYIYKKATTEFVIASSTVAFDHTSADTNNSERLYAALNCTTLGDNKVCIKVNLQANNIKFINNNSIIELS